MRTYIFFYKTKKNAKKKHLAYTCNATTIYTTLVRLHAYLNKAIIWYRARSVIIRQRAINFNAHFPALPSEIIKRRTYVYTCIAYI